MGRSMAIATSGPSPRQHADQGAEKDADERVKQVGSREDGIETECEIGEDFHRAYSVSEPCAEDRHGHAKAPDKYDDGKNRQH